MWFTLQISSEARIQGEEQVQAFRRSQALYLAIGGCYEALGRMGVTPETGLEDRSDLSWQPDGTTHSIRYETGEAVISIQSEAKKININQVRPEDLKEILTKAGFPEGGVDQVADSIADFIDTDEFPRLNGAEADAYKRLGLPYGPFNAPLLSLDQLLLIPGITAPLLFGHLRAAGEEEGAETQTPNPALPARDSLFEMVSVYGKNTSLREMEFEAELDRNKATWENGGYYRIYSTAKTFSGSPPVTVCLIVRFAPDNKAGYEVVYRKIL